MVSDEPLSILLLTEDSGGDGYSTLHALAQRMLEKLGPAIDTSSIEFEPTQNENAKKALRGNAWDVSKPAPDAHFNSTELALSIATKLAEGGFVFFHIDGDQPWKHRKKTLKPARFRDDFAVRIRQVLNGWKKDKKAIEAAMKRLVLILPFYSIESWLFQNTDQAIRLCHKHHSGKDVKRFEEWRENRSRLDEELKPKEQVCLKAKHNLALATIGFPADEVHAVGKSFKQAVETLGQCTELVAALARLVSSSTPAVQ